MVDMRARWTGFAVAGHPRPPKTQGGTLAHRMGGLPLLPRSSGPKARAESHYPVERSGGAKRTATPGRLASLRNYQDVAETLSWLTAISASVSVPSGLCWLNAAGLVRQSCRCF